jgi:succinyl-diaminopimelate desuccinylase
MSAVDVVALTQALVRADTVNPPGREEACARHLGALLEGAGFRVRLHALGVGRASLVATLGGTSGSAPICFSGHLDVVPLGMATWARDPFAGELDAGRVHGRGASDMKGGVAAIVAAAVSLAPYLDRSAGVSIVLTAGEETGCQGAFDLAARPGALGPVGALVVAEPTGNHPMVGHKGALWLAARTRGIAAHGSTPELGDNAVFKAARAVGRLEGHRCKHPEHALMGRCTLNVGTIRGGQNINSVPDEAVFGIDMRTLPGQRHADLRGDIARLLGPEVELETLLDLPGVLTDPGHEWVQRVRELVTPYLGRVPEVRTDTAFSDASALVPAMGGPPVIILGPGEPELAHQTDEYCVVDRLHAATGAFSDIIRDWCAG